MTQVMGPGGPAPREVRLRYIRGGCIECPACGSDLIQSCESSSTGPDTMVREVHCDDCGAAWDEVLRVVGVESLRRR